MMSQARRPALTALLCLAAAASPAAQETSLQRAVRLTGEGDLSAALSAARSGQDPLTRAQGELYVLHHAGALESALQAGLRGLESAPKDPWLLERSAYIALSLGAGGLASGLSEELQAAVSPAEWSRHEWMLSEARSLESTRAAEADSLRRAQLVSALMGVGAVVLALILGLRRTEPASR
jgi:hypothetical protein